MGAGLGWREDCELTNHGAVTRTPQGFRRRRGRPVSERTWATLDGTAVAERGAQDRSPKGDAPLVEVVADIRAMRLGRHGALPHSAVVANADAWRLSYPRAVA